MQAGLFCSIIFEEARFVFRMRQELKRRRFLKNEAGSEL